MPGKITAAVYRQQRHDAAVAILRAVQRAANRKGLREDVGTQLGIYTANDLLGLDCLLPDYKVKDLIRFDAEAKPKSKPKNKRES